MVRWLFTTSTLVCLHRVVFRDQHPDEQQRIVTEDVCSLFEMLA